MFAFENSYIDDHDPIAPLPAEEERELARRVRDHGDEEACHRLVRANMRFVYKVAHSFGGYGLRFEDLVQEGMVGLLEAIKRFDPERGTRLISYAVHWMRAQIQAHVIQQYSLVRVGTSQLQRRLFYRLRKAENELAAEEDDGELSADARLARHFEVTERSIRDMRKRLSGRDVSFETPDRDDGSAGLDNRLAADLPSPEETAIASELTCNVRDRLPGLLESSLDERERYILDLRLFEDKPWTLQAIGETLGITRERTRQLEARAKKKLAAGLSDLADLAA